MGRSAVLVLAAVAIGGCSPPTLPVEPSPIAGTLAARDGPTRNGIGPGFDPARNLVAAPSGIVVTGYLPYDLCRGPLSASYSRAGSRLFVTLTRGFDPFDGCLAWIAETRYSVTLRGLETGRYDVFVIEKPWPASGETRVDTFAVGSVNGRSRQ
jgi:hypothetical protein